ncbi:hypothetical protein N7470_010271, partial [Penicillium chermesinum]
PPSRPAPAPDRPSFTFIDHDDDLTSKRIKDINARKAIRSHVMRDVRRRERLAGTKRTSRRENRGQNSATKSKCKDEVPEEQCLVLRYSSSQSSFSPVGSSSTASLSTSKHRRRPSRWTTHPLVFHWNPSPYSLPTAWFCDPFCSLPGLGELPMTVGTLVYYWKNTFVPMTFPSGLKNSQIPELELMVRSSFSDPGSFFGLMTMCAAHRAALGVGPSDRTVATDLVANDQDYCVMKGKSIREMNVKVRDPALALTDEAFDTIVNLLTGSLIAGQFDEARIHLTGLKHMERCKSRYWTHDQTCLPLTWDAQPVPADIQQRIRPPASSPIRRIGSGFWANTLLSQPLLRILTVIQDMIFYSITLRAAPQAIEQRDHDFIHLLNCEAEHQLLSYIYTDDSESSQTPEPDLEIHPIESVTRVASICFLNHLLIVSPPSSGLGRALTKHLVKEVRRFKISLLMELPKENTGLYAWSLFIGAQGSLGHPERRLFVERLAHVAMLCGWQSWEQVSRILTDYYFIPEAQGPSWQIIWDEAMAGFVVPGDAIS